MNIPQTHYATARDGTSIAYATFGDASTDILVSHPWLSHLEIYWEWPGYERFIRGLADGARVILFDKRGVGLSGPTFRDPDLETRMQDIRTVLDAAGSERQAVFGWGEGAAVAAMLAATYPDRVSALILYAPAVRFLLAPDFPDGFDAGAWDEEDSLLIGAWGDEEHADVFLQYGCGITDPVLQRDPALRRWGARFQRYACTPDAFPAFRRVFSATDARAILPAVRVPTLVLEGSCDSPDPWARDVAARIPGAQFEVIEQPQWAPWLGRPQAFGPRIHRFLDDLRREAEEMDRVLATVLFTDIVGSTERAAAMGDRAWGELVQRHDAAARALVERYHGRWVRSTGDGILATFDGPARAVRCAEAIVHGVEPLGLRVRAGCHTGEIELLGDDIGGIGVHIGARVAALAGPSEVLVSSTVKDLTVGAGLAFEDRGEHELKGVPDRWHLYRVAAG